MTIEEFRAYCRAVAIVYRGQADELDALAEREEIPNASQGVDEVKLIFQKTQRACWTLAEELDPTVLGEGQ